VERIAILGGGPAGLYAALLLARRGIPVTLLERSEAVGGLAGGMEVAGVSVDFGSHRLHPSASSDVLNDLTDLLGERLQRRRRNGRILLDDTWISFPLSPPDLVRHLDRRVLLRLGLGALAASFRRSQSGTFEEFVVTGLGGPMGDLFYFPYARKIWGIEPSLLSGEQARRRISADRPYRLLRKLLSGPSDGRLFVYPAGGFGEITRGLAELAATEGAEIVLGAPVEGITRTSAGFAVASSSSTVESSLLLSTIPITALTLLLGAPPELLSAVRSLEYRAMILVYLVIPEERWTEYDAHYFPGPAVPFTRISEPKNYRSGPDPDDRTVICVEIPADIGDVRWESNDQDLLDEVRSQIRAVGLPDPGNQGLVHRIPHAYPIYRIGVEQSLAAVSDWLDTVEGVVTFGRQGLFAHDNTHHTMAMARAAVECIGDNLRFDRGGWEAARERFAEHVVED